MTAQATRAAQSPAPITKPITGRSLISGTAVNYLGQAVLALTGFFLTPYMIDTLGKRHYGILALVAALMGYASLLDFGLGFSVMKLIPDAADRSDRTRVHRLVSSVLAFYGVMGLVVALSLLAIFPLIRGDLPAPPARPRSAALVLHPHGHIGERLLPPSCLHRDYHRASQLCPTQPPGYRAGASVLGGDPGRAQARLRHRCHLRLGRGGPVGLPRAGPYAA